MKTASLSKGDIKTYNMTNSIINFTKVLCALLICAGLVVAGCTEGSLGDGQSTDGPLGDDQSAEQGANLSSAGTANSYIVSAV